MLSSRAGKWSPLAAVKFRYSCACHQAEMLSLTSGCFLMFWAPEGSCWTGGALLLRRLAELSLCGFLVCGLPGLPRTAAAGTYILLLMPFTANHHEMLCTPDAYRSQGAPSKGATAWAKCDASTAVPVAALAPDAASAKACAASQPQLKQNKEGQHETLTTTKKEGSRCRFVCGDFGRHTCAGVPSIGATCRVCRGVRCPRGGLRCCDMLLMRSACRQSHVFHTSQPSSGPLWAAMNRSNQCKPAEKTSLAPDISRSESQSPEQRSVGQTQHAPE